MGVFLNRCILYKRVFWCDTEISIIKNLTSTCRLLYERVELFRKLTYVKIRLLRRHLLDLRAENLSKNAIQIRKLCGHILRCACKLKRSFWAKNTLRLRWQYFYSVGEMQQTGFNIQLITLTFYRVRFSAYLRTSVLYQLNRLFRVYNWRISPAWRKSTGL